MSKAEELLQKVLSGDSDSNIHFRELQKLLLSKGFRLRVRGDHFIFSHIDVAEIVNLQPVGHLAKAYQVRQVRSILIRYRMAGGR